MKTELNLKNCLFWLKIMKLFNFATPYLNGRKQTKFITEILKKQKECG